MQKKFRLTILMAIMVAALVNCSKSNDVTPPDFEALPLTIPVPADNPQSAQKIALGRMLFFDPVLSGNKDVACATCHHPTLNYADALDLSIGVNGKGLGTARHFLTPNNIPFAKRNAFSVVNSAFNGISKDGSCDAATAAMFFDNRTHSLELQSLEPIKSLEEMKGTSISSAAILDTVVQRIRSISQYAQLFNAAFGGNDAVTTQNMGKAIASYERSLISNHSPFDEYMRGNTSAMSATQIQGMNLFASNGCVKCHSGPMFSDYSLHVLSVPDNTKLPTDAGANGTYAFRTPGLRNVTQTAPYMHSGVLRTLDAVFNFYDAVGNRRSQNAHVTAAQLDADLQRINERDKDAIIAFLGALTDSDFDKTVPGSVPSGLRPGGNVQ
jgi:cytochrome c peroxidase